MERNKAKAKAGSVSPALKCSYLGAAAAVLSGAYTATLCLPGGALGWRGIPDTLILLLGGWGILKGKRLISVILPAYILASRYQVGMILGFTGPSFTDLLVFPAYALGILGAFVRNRAARLERRAPDTRLLDADIAASFTRLAGITGISFGILTGMFAVAELGGFTRFNLTDAFLILLFSWYTIRRRLWAASAQLVLSFGNMALAYHNTGNLAGVFGFFPMFLFILYALGAIGAAALRQPRHSISGRAGPTHNPGGLPVPVLGQSKRVSEKR